MREPGWNERVKIERVSDHFIFSVESTGALPARTLVQEAVKILVAKCQTVLEAAGGSTGAGIGEPGAGGEGALPELDRQRTAIFKEATMRSTEDDLGDMA